jgi:hypothetical protein
MTFFDKAIIWIKNNKILSISMIIVIALAYLSDHFQDLIIHCIEGRTRKSVVYVPTSITKGNIVMHLVFPKDWKHKILTNDKLLTIRYDPPSECKSFMVAYAEKPCKEFLTVEDSSYKENSGQIVLDLYEISGLYYPVCQPVYCELQAYVEHRISLIKEETIKLNMGIPRLIEIPFMTSDTIVGVQIDYDYIKQDNKFKEMQLITLINGTAFSLRLRKLETDTCKIEKIFAYIVNNCYIKEI